MTEASRNEYIKEASDYLRGTLSEGLADEITGAIAESDQQLVTGESLRLHAARANSGRRADHQAMADARLGRARLWQRHDACDNAPDDPAARRHQVEPESDAQGD